MTLTSTQKTAPNHGSNEKYKFKIRYDAMFANRFDLEYIESISPHYFVSLSRLLLLELSMSSVSALTSNKLPHLSIYFICVTHKRNDFVCVSCVVVVFFSFEISLEICMQWHIICLCRSKNGQTQLSRK